MPSTSGSRWGRWASAPGCSTAFSRRCVDGVSEPRSGRVPPVAPREPYVRRVHGVATPDPYRWMRNRADPRLTAYLAEERAYYDEATARLEPLRAELRSELARRLPAGEDSIPWRRGPYCYLWRTPAGEGRRAPRPPARARGRTGPGGGH